MIEMMFGSGSPMWAALPAIGPAYPPIGLGSRLTTTPMIGSPVPAGGLAGGSGLLGMSAPGALSNALYSPEGGMMPGAQQNLGGTGFSAGYPYVYPFVSNPLAALIGADGTGFVTASSLLQAVAMRRGQPQGPTNDHEVEEFIYDALDLLPGAADVEVRCENANVTLTGTVPHKRAKHDVGEIVWAISGVQDIQNNLSIASRRRGRLSGREADAPVTPSVPVRKQG